MLKMNRKQLDDKAGEIRTLLRLGDDVGNADVFFANIKAEWDAFQDFCKEGHTADEEKSAVKSVNKAISLYHEEMQTQRLEQLSAMSSAEADAEYLRCQSVCGWKTSNSTQRGWELLTKVTKNRQEEQVYSTISAYDFVKTVHPVEANGIFNLCTIFAEFAAMEKVGTEGIARMDKFISPAYQARIEALAAKGGCWQPDEKTKKFSKTKLAKQMTEIWKMIFHGVDVPSAENCDVRFVQDTLTNAKIITGNDGNMRGTYVKKNEETIINAIYTAAFHRMNKLAYEFQDKSNLSNTPFGETENKAMGEGKAKPAPVPAVETVAPAA